jgi:uncharacterized protein (DUF2344 family)
MTKSRRKLTAEQKAAIAEELSIQPTQIHPWVAMALDHVERAFEKTAKSEKASNMAEAKVAQLKEQQIQKLHEKLIHKNEVIAELMEKKCVPPTYRATLECKHSVIQELQAAHGLRSAVKNRGDWIFSKIHYLRGHS